MRFRRVVCICPHFFKCAISTFPWEWVPRLPPGCAFHVLFCLTFYHIVCIFRVSAGVCCLSDIISAFEHGDLSLFESSAIENWHYYYYLQAFYPRYSQQNINSDSDLFRNLDNLSQNPHNPTETEELTSGINSTRDACQTMIFTIFIMPPIVFNHAG